MRKRHSAGQIVVKLRQADLALGKGVNVPEVCDAFHSCDNVVCCD